MPTDLSYYIFHLPKCCKTREAKNFNDMANISKKSEIITSYGEILKKMSILITMPDYYRRGVRGFDTKFSTTFITMMEKLIFEINSTKFCDIE